jgi:hypothetical protein
MTNTMLLTKKSLTFDIFRSLNGDRGQNTDIKKTTGLGPEAAG